jgi:hypothetical protein
MEVIFLLIVISFTLLLAVAELQGMPGMHWHTL